MGKKKTEKKKDIEEKKESARTDKYTELVAPKLYYVQALSAADVPKSEIASKLGISRQTFSAYEKKYPALARAMSKGREDICNNVRSALYRRAMGYDYSETRTYTRKGVTEYETIEKHCPADVRAGMVLLRQYDPEYRDKGAAGNMTSEPVQVIFEKNTEEAGV